MKFNRIFIIFFIILCFAFPTHARLMGTITISSLTEESDIVAVGYLTKVTETNERTTLPYGNGKIDVTGMEAVFDIDKVFKGELKGDKVILHYYRSAKDPHEMINGPFWLNLEIKGNRIAWDQETGKEYRTSTYLLFMKKTDDGRYMPTSGYIDSAFSIAIIQGMLDLFGSFKMERGNALKWDQLKPDKNLFPKSNFNK